MSTLLFIMGGSVIIGGSMIFSLAKRGEQNTLGGFVAIVGLVILALAALVRVAGAHDLDARIDDIAASHWRDSKIPSQRTDDSDGLAPRSCG